MNLLLIIHPLLVGLAVLLFVLWIVELVSLASAPL